jgi:hypothetical protein
MGLRVFLCFEVRLLLLNRKVDDVRRSAGAFT